MRNCWEVFFFFFLAIPHYNINKRVIAWIDTLGNFANFPFWYTYISQRGWDDDEGLQRVAAELPQGGWDDDGGLQHVVAERPQGGRDDDEGLQLKHFKLIAYNIG